MSPEFPLTLGMLVAQLVPEFLDYRVHLVFQVKFLLLQSDFFKMIVLGQVVAMVQIVKFAFIGLVFFDQTAELWIRGHQVFLDILLLHHHCAPPH
jgi:hypothetical protein